MDQELAIESSKKKPATFSSLHTVIYFNWEIREG